MSKHAPGPWRAECVKTSCGHAWQIGPFNCCIYVDHRAPDEPDGVEAEANAKLIAAAPDLLEALKELVVRVDLPASRYEPSKTIIAIDNAHAAIKEATE